MPTTLRPNDIDYTVAGTPDDPAEVLATVVQPIPSSDQSETIIMYFTGFTNEEDDTDGTVTYKCYRADITDPADVILGVQVPGDYIYNSAIPAEGDPTHAQYFLIWVDRAPGQAGAYAITGLLEGDGVAFIDGSSVALLTIGA